MQQNHQNPDASIYQNSSVSMQQQQHAGNAQVGIQAPHHQVQAIDLQSALAQGLIQYGQEQAAQFQAYPDALASSSSATMDFSQYSQEQSFQFNAQASSSASASASVPINVAQPATQPASSSKRKRAAAKPKTTTKGKGKGKATAADFEDEEAELDFQAFLEDEAQAQAQTSSTTKKRKAPATKQPAAANGTPTPAKRRSRGKSVTAANNTAAALGPANALFQGPGASMLGRVPASATFDPDLPIKMPADRCYNPRVPIPGMDGREAYRLIQMQDQQLLFQAQQQRQAEQQRQAQLQHQMQEQFQAQQQLQMQQQQAQQGPVFPAAAPAYHQAMSAQQQQMAPVHQQQAASVHHQQASAAPIPATPRRGPATPLEKAIQRGLSGALKAVMSEAKESGTVLSMMLSLPFQSFDNNRLMQALTSIRDSTLAMQPATEMAGYCTAARALLVRLSDEMQQFGTVFGLELLAGRVIRPSEEYAEMARRLARHYSTIMNRFGMPTTFEGGPGIAPASIISPPGQVFLPDGTPVDISGDVPVVHQNASQSLFVQQPPTFGGFVNGSPIGYTNHVNNGFVGYNSDDNVFTSPAQAPRRRPQTASTDGDVSMVGGSSTAGSASGSSTDNSSVTLSNHGSPAPAPAGMMSTFQVSVPGGRQTDETNVAQNGGLPPPRPAPDLTSSYNQVPLPDYATIEKVDTADQAEFSAIMQLAEQGRLQRERELHREMQERIPPGMRFRPEPQLVRDFDADEEYDPEVTNPDDAAGPPAKKARGGSKKKQGKAAATAEASAVPDPETGSLIPATQAGSRPCIFYHFPTGDFFMKTMLAKNWVTVKLGVNTSPANQETLNNFINDMATNHGIHLNSTFNFAYRFYITPEANFRALQHVLGINGFEQRKLNWREGMPVKAPHTGIMGIDIDQEDIDRQPYEANLAREKEEERIIAYQVALSDAIIESVEEGSAFAIPGQPGTCQNIPKTAGPAFLRYEATRTQQTQQYMDENVGVVGYDGRVLKTVNGVPVEEDTTAAAAASKGDVVAEELQVQHAIEQQAQIQQTAAQQTQVAVVNTIQPATSELQAVALSTVNQAATTNSPVVNNNSEFILPATTTATDAATGDISMTDFLNSGEDVNVGPDADASSGMEFIMDNDWDRDTSNIDPLDLELFGGPVLDYSSAAGYQ